MRRQTDTIGDMDDDGMGEAVAVSDKVYVLPNDGRVKLCEAISEGWRCIRCRFGKR